MEFATRSDGRATGMTPSASYKRVGAMRSRSSPCRYGQPDAKHAGREGYARVERCKRNVTLETLKRIADGLGVDLSVRFGGPRKLPPSRRGCWREWGRHRSVPLPDRTFR